MQRTHRHTHTDTHTETHTHTVCASQSSVVNHIKMYETVDFLTHKEQLENVASFSTVVNLALVKVTTAERD